MVTKALVGDLRDGDKQSNRINTLESNGKISKKTQDVLTIVNKIRNDMLHDPLSLFQRYSLDKSHLIDFKKKLNDEIQAELLDQELSIAKDSRSFLEDRFTWGVVQAYAKVYNAHNHEVQMSIRSYIASQS